MNLQADQVMITGAPLAPKSLESALGKLPKSKGRHGSEKAGATGCMGELRVNFFFDGTCNNLMSDAGVFRHSNVARLYRAHVGGDPARNIYPEYLAGIGSYFKDWLTGKEDKGKNFTEAGMGAGGQTRLECALARLEHWIKVVENQSPSMKIRKIHVTIFGFSRGAALARAFAVTLEQLTRLSEGDQSEARWYKGAHPHPFEITFMGLFDTVASVGRPASLQRYSTPLRLLGGISGEVLSRAAETAQGHDGWARDLRIPSRRLVKRCLHLVAAHEVRASFPLDLVLLGDRLPSNCTEILYPGAHSDVGGGYRPGEQGRGAPKKAGQGQKLSQIPLIHMYREAWKAGVPLRHPARKTKDPKICWGPDQVDDFVVDPAMVKLFNAYLSSLKGLNPGSQTSLQAWIEGHMGLYFRWRGTVLDQPPPPDHSGVASEDIKKFEKGTQTANDELKEKARILCRSSSVKSPYQRLISKAWEVYRWESPLPSGGTAAQAPSADVQHFFGSLVHDSASGFAVDGHRLWVPRNFYVGKDQKAIVAKLETQPQDGESATA